MKKWLIFWACAVIAVGAVCAYSRSTHTDLIDYSDLTGSVGDYALIASDIISSPPEDYLPVYDTAQYIVKVTPTGMIENQFQTTHMECVVQEVYRGDESLAGKTIIFNDMGSIMPDSKTFSGVSVNYMKQGHEYLLFMNDWQPPEGYVVPEGKQYYSYVSDLSIWPSYFDFADCENVFPSAEEISKREIPLPLYRDEAENEFFITNQSSLDFSLELKEALMEKYVP